MTVQEVSEFIASWAPPAIAWEKDNVGLQCGDPAEVVRGIMVALDATEVTIKEAQARRANLIVTHHPLLFRPLRSISTATSVGRSCRELLKNDITLISAHTNLDFTRGGTSFALAGLLGIGNAEFLHMPYQVEKKIVTFVPAAHADAVTAAMASAGAGVIGNYDHCSFRTAGRGSFRGNDASRPTTGVRGRLEQVEEIRIEMVVPSWNTERVVRALRESHPYEEPAFDIIPTENRSREYGMGVIGSLRKPQTLRGFLRGTKKALRSPGLRWAGDPRKMVRRVAACGGSGGDLLEEAIRKGADVYVTADLKYHAYHDATGVIALVDAGHYETEVPVVRVVADRLLREIRRRQERIPVGVAGFRNLIRIV